MRQIRLPGWLGALLLASGLTVFLTSAARLNTSWLVPTGNIKVDYKSLSMPDRKICALTFDDGPDAKFTPAVAAILADHKVKATFFVVGSRVDINPQGVKDLLAAGHEIGNHTQSHPYMNQLSSAGQARQITQLQDSLGKLGVTPRWFRPPYGAFNTTTVKTASKLGMETVLWSVDPQDWAEPGADKITERVLKGTVPGAVILLHSTHGQTVQALPAIIAGLQKRGYSFLTMTQWQAAVTGGKLPLPAASLPLADSGSSSEIATSAPPAGPSLVPKSDQPAAKPAAQQSDQGAPRLLPPFQAGPDHAAQPSPEPAELGVQAEPAPGANSTQPAVTSRPTAEALTVAANIDGPEEVLAVWDRAQGGTWRQWSSDLAAYGGQAGYLAGLGPAAATALQSTGQSPIAEASESGAMEPNAAGWDGPWQAAASLSIDDVLTSEQGYSTLRFRPAPQFYLLGLGNFSGYDLWEDLSAYQAAARIDGLLSGGQLSLGSIPSAAPAPRAAVAGANLAPDAIIDPGLQGSLRAMTALQAGYNNLYLAVRPSNASGFAQGQLGRGQRELLLLRRLVSGLSLDAAPENDLAQSWALPVGVQMLRFFDPQREVLALFCPSGDCDALGLPAAAQDYRIATLTEDNQLALSPVNLPTVELGRNVLLLYRDVGQ